MELSPGLAQSAFELLALIGRQALTIDAVLSGLRRISGMPSNEVLDFTQTMNWIQVADTGMLGASPAGLRVLERAAYPAMLRSTLIDHATILSPPWLQNARMGRNRTLSFAPIGVQQTLVEAGVAEGTGEDVVTFWDQLAALARGSRDERLAAIGRIGERLTLAYEEARTGRVPRWAAIDSNADGFDVLSSIDAKNSSPLSIEVKTTTMGKVGELVLTRNEWDTALDSAAHRFDLWDVAKSGSPICARVATEEMREHIPADSASGRWASVAIPFAAFSGSFGPP